MSIKLRILVVDDEQAVQLYFKKLLTDEGYEYRKPTKIYLQKGWNHILIKAPIASFKGKDWQNPVKWMFTFVEL